MHFFWNKFVSLFNNKGYDEILPFKRSRVILMRRVLVSSAVNDIGMS